jgi:hypothetical protein
MKFDQQTTLLVGGRLAASAAPEACSHAVWSQPGRKMKILLLLLVVMVIQGCSYQGWHEGLKQAQKSECTKLMEPDRRQCLESLDYSFEEYERERRKRQTLE